jgi:hypothetical protein
MNSIWEAGNILIFGEKCCHPDEESHYWKYQLPQINMYVLYNCQKILKYLGKVIQKFIWKKMSKNEMSEL